MAVQTPATKSFPRPLTLAEAREIIGSLVQRIETLQSENAGLAERLRQKPGAKSLELTDPGTSGEKDKAAMLVVLAGLRDGRKMILAVESGYRESTES